MTILEAKIGGMQKEARTQNDPARQLEERVLISNRAYVQNMHNIFEVIGKEKIVCRLKKSLYGLK